MKNHGVIQEPLIHTLMFIGGLGAQFPDRLPFGDWRPHRPRFERQSRFGLDSMNCVQFSRLNVCEYQANFYGVPEDDADRDLYHTSGCTAQGNSYGKCDAALRKHGVAREELWPWEEKMTREQYDAEPPAEAVEDRKNWLAKWDVQDLIWVPKDKDSIMSGLRKSPLWFFNSGHSMTMEFADDKGVYIFDHYPGSDGDGESFHTYESEFYKDILGLYVAPITPKGKNPMPAPATFPFKENTLYQLVEGVGGFFLYAKGHLYRDKTAELMASWEVRNNGDTKGKVGVLTIKDIVDVQLWNLKSEKVSL